MAHRIAIRKAGTRAGQPHYSVVCRGCSDYYGAESVLAIGHLSREGAALLGEQHKRRA